MVQPAKNGTGDDIDTFSKSMSSFEASDLSFPLAGRLMGQLDAVVGVLCRVMERTGKSILDSRPTARQLVGQQLDAVAPLGLLSPYERIAQPPGRRGDAGRGYRGHHHPDRRHATGSGSVRE